MRTFLCWIPYLILFEILILSTTTDGTVQVSYIDINKNGTVHNEALLPKCAKRESINLLAYSYLNRTCNPGPMCINLQNGNLSPAAELSIHKSCSLKEACQNVSFPISDIQTHGYNTVDVRYQCLDHFSFLGLCSNTETTINSTIHLISNELTTSLEGCECQADGAFTLTLSDIRLNAKNKAICSSAVLNIKFNSFTCDGSKKDFGSVFRKPMEGSMERATISLATHSRNVTPEMVWLSLVPKQSLALSCKNVQRKVSTTTTLPVSKARKIAYSGMNSEDSDVNTSSPSKSSMKAVVILVVVCTIIILIVVCIVFIMWRRNNRKKQLDLDKSTEIQTVDRVALTSAEEDTEANLTIHARLCTHNNLPQEKHVYEKLKDSRKKTPASDIEEEQYDTTQFNKKVTVDTQTYDHLASKSDSNSRSWFQKLLENNPIYSFATDQARTEEYI